MKVLYIGNYRDGTGWGNAAKNNILALDSAGVDVVIRPITYNNSNITDPRLENLESKSLSNVDICIQHSLPTTYKYSNKFKNIGLYYTETNNWKYSLWHKYINLMDEAWVSSRCEVVNSKNSGVKIPIKVFNNSIEYDKYQNSSFKTAKIVELKTGFNFCFFGEFNYRKNISALIQAYHTEFHPSEDVNLFFKLNDPSTDAQTCMNKANQLNDVIKSNLKIRRKYKDIYIMSGYLKHEDYISIMSQCHCMVVPSYGEACCIPILEAHALGLEVIYTAKTGMFDYASYDYSYQIDSKQIPCYGMTHSLPELYSSLDSWQQIEINSLRNMMRKIYERYKQRSEEDKKHISEIIKNHAKKYDIKMTGLQMKEMLCQ